MDKKELLFDIFNAAIKAVEPKTAVKNMVRFVDGRLITGEISFCNINYFDRTMVVGAGKGASLMAKAVEEVIGDKLDEGIIIVKYGHTLPLNRIRQIEAGHPIPDEAGVNGTEAIIKLLETADEKTLVICLLSGGGSAMLVSPAEGISLKDKQITTDLLLKAGASIDELNTVRKHLSRVKGGKLARIAFPATVITLILSDVIGDRLDVIASGPTVPDSSTFNDAIMVVDKYGLRNRLPEKIMTYLESGAAGKTPDMSKTGEDCFKKGFTVIAGSLRQALYAARNEAEGMGFDTQIVADKLQGEAREAASYLADISLTVKNSIKSGRHRCLISGGETTVTVRGSGKGGRNQELALAFAMEIEGKDGITMLSAGTDGTDGPTDAAGAVVNGNTVKLAKGAGLEPQVYLANNDSFTFFERLDVATDNKHHLKTGPTGTNVMDIQIILIN